MSAYLLQRYARNVSCWRARGISSARSVCFNTSILVSTQAGYSPMLVTFNHNFLSFFPCNSLFFARALLDHINSLLFTPLEGLRELGRRRGRLHEGTDLDGVIFKTSSDFYPEGHTFIGTSSRMFGLLGSPRLASSSSSLTQRTKQLRGSDISHTQHSMTSHNLPTLVDFFMRVHERASLPPLRNAPCP